MSISIHWDEPSSNILVFSFKGHWTIQEYEDALSFGRMMLSNVIERVSAVFDLSQSELPPLTLSHLMKKVSRILLPPSIQELVIVHNEGMSNSLQTAFDHILPLGEYHNHIAFAHDMDTARHIILKHAIAWMESA